MTLGKHLRSLRGEMSRDEVAKRIASASVSSLRKWESDHRIPAYDHLDALHELYGACIADRIKSLMLASDARRAVRLGVKA